VCGGGDWGYVESELGLSLSEEYKALVERFLAGQFNGSLEVIQPRSADQADVEAYLDRVFDEAERLDEAVREMGVPVTEVFPKVPGLFPWADMEGEYLACCYLGDPSADSSANYVARVPTGAWVEMHGSIARCLVDMITGRVYRVRGLLSTDKPPDFFAYPPRTFQREVLTPGETWETRASLSILPYYEPANAVDALLGLGLDTGRAEVVDWVAVEQRLGHRLPADYKRFVETIGPGRYGNILVANPNGPKGDVPGLFDLAASARESLARRYVNPPPVAPDPGGILVWGQAPHGWFCGWATPDDFVKDMGAVLHFTGLRQRGTGRSMTNYLHWYLTEEETFNTAPWSLPRPGDARKRWKRQKQ